MLLEDYRAIKLRSLPGCFIGLGFVRFSYIFNSARVNNWFMI
jgi:hypothetical protein